MKSIIRYSFILLTLLFLTGCYYEEVIEVVDEVEEVIELDEEPLTEQEAIDTYGGSYGFIWDDYGDTFYFPYDDSNIIVCIDSNLSEDLITAVIMAVEEFDALEYISLTYELSDDLDTDIIEGCSLEAEVYDHIIIFTSYRDTEVDWCSDNDEDVLGCNVYDIDGLQIISSVIYFNLNLLEGEDFSLLEHVALHELGHTFGLDDLYVEELGQYTIMYNNTEHTPVDLLPYDLYNLEWMYNTNDEDTDN